MCHVTAKTCHNNQSFLGKKLFCGFVGWSKGGGSQALLQGPQVLLEHPSGALRKKNLGLKFGLFFKVRYFLCGPPIVGLLFFRSPSMI